MTDIELLYNEFVRLAGVIDAYTFSSFGDFQLVAVVGAMLAWKPIADRLTKFDRASEESCKILLSGFVAISAILTILAMRDVLRHSIIQFHLQQAELYEQAIKDVSSRLTEASISQLPEETFQTSRSWQMWQKYVHLPILLMYRGFFVFALLLFPSVVLWWSCPRRYVTYYVACTLILMTIYTMPTMFLASVVW